MEALNAKFQEEIDDYIVPDGFKKVVEKVPITIY